MPAKKTAKSIVAKAFPHQLIADAVPVNTSPTVRKGVSRNSATAIFKGVKFSGNLGKSKAKTLLVRPENSADADSRTVSKSVIADGMRIIAIQG